MTEKYPQTAPAPLADNGIGDGVNPDYGWNVARAQKALLVAFILQLCSALSNPGWPLYLCGAGLACWAVYNLGDALRAHKDGFALGGGGKWLVLVWIPYVGFIALLILNRKATRFLKEAGYKVGLFGARRKLNR